MIFSYYLNSLTFKTVRRLRLIKINRSKIQNYNKIKGKRADIDLEQRKKRTFPPSCSTIDSKKQHVLTTKWKRAEKIKWKMVKYKNTHEQQWHVTFFPCLHISMRAMWYFIRTEGGCSMTPHGPTPWCGLTLKPSPSNDKGCRIFLSSD